MATEGVSPGTIVVGVDGSEHAQRALAWAAEQARLEGRQLTVVHAAGLGGLDSTGWVGSGDSDFPELMTAAREVVGDAMARVESAVSGLRMVGVPCLGDARQVLVDLSEEAYLVVVGSRGRGTFRSMMLGSVSVSVAKHAHCPVVVTRPGPGSGREGGVLVGADGTTESVPVIEYAFRQASLRGAPLTVMHASFDVDVALASVSGGHPRSDGAEDRKLLLSESVAGLSEKFPDVHVSLQLGQGLVDECLARESRSRDLVVVGRHRVSSVTKLLTGSIAAAVLERATSPVAVVPEADPASAPA